MTAHSDRVTVIIPAGDAPDLDRTLASVAGQQDAESIEEVIVVGGDRRRDARDPIRVRLVQTDRPVTSPVARNIGILASDTDWLAFLDADCVAEPDWLRTLLAAGHAGHPVVGGGVSFGHSSYWADVHNVSMLHDYHLSAPVGQRLFLPTINLLVGREVIASVGLMDESLRRAQDLEWTTRMSRQGIALWFEPRAIVTHHPVRQPRSLWRDYFETGHTSYLVRRQRTDRMALPSWLRSALLLRAISPVIAAAATLRIFIARRGLARYLIAAPGIWLTKLAWCLGAASGAADQGRP